MRIAGQILRSHAGRGADSRSGFAHKAAMPNVIFEIAAESIDLEVVAPDPLGMAALPFRAQSLVWLGCMATGRPEEAGGGAERRRKTPSRPNRHG
ncbi:MAG: hypothetical protein DYH03_20300 [Nitrospira sp. NTP1]|nr:hypothetical protein [Nitrospira sp. NTP1]